MYSTQILLRYTLCPWFTFSIILIGYGQCDRQKMVSDYKTSFLGSHVSTTELGWTGDQQSCQSGDISKIAKEKTLMRINYYRRLAKIPTEIAFDETLSQMCQEAAVIMHSNNQLTHAPTKEWSCFSENGKLAAGKSNLALGAHTSDAIALYMKDPGSNNTAVGHRRWILYSRADTFGMGSTSRAHALYVVHTRVPVPDHLDYIAYPSPGFFPAPLVPDRWSLSVPNANFNEVEISMFDEQGGEIQIEILPYKGGFGDNTIVWEPAHGAVEKSSIFDQKFRIILSNIILKNESKHIEYEVIISKPDHPPACIEGRTWSETECACILEQTTPVQDQAHQDEQLTLSPTLANNFVKIERSSRSEIKDATLIITDYAGRSMFKMPINQEATISTSTYSPGFYIAILKTRSKVLSQKFAVIH